MPGESAKEDSPKHPRLTTDVDDGFSRHRACYLVRVSNDVIDVSTSRHCFMRSGQSGPTPSHSLTGHGIIFLTMRMHWWNIIQFVWIAGSQITLNSLTLGNHSLFVSILAMLWLHLRLVGHTLSPSLKIDSRFSFSLPFLHINAGSPSPNTWNTTG